MKTYERWLEVSAELKRLKAEELTLRNKITSKILTDKLEGAKTESNTKYKVTATARLNRSLDRELLEAIWEDLTIDEQECVEYKPSLVLTNYRKFEERGGKLLEAVTVKPGQASLKIERLGE